MPAAIASVKTFLRYLRVPASIARGGINLNPAVQASFHRKNQGTVLFCGIPREAGGGPSAMRDRPDEVYASRRAPAMRAESCNCNFQVNEHIYE